MKRICIFLVLINIVYFLWQVRSQEFSANPSIDATTPSLVLMDETPKQKVDSALQKPIQTDDGAPAKVAMATQSCVVLGGFIDQVTAENAGKFLSERGIASKLYLVEIQGENSYLVYLPPFASRAEAVTKLNELKSEAIDSFIIADGERVNGISLGVFAREESAKKLQSQLGEKGYRASLVNTSRVSRQYTLQIGDHIKDMLTESVSAEVSQKYAGNKLTRVTSPCDE